MAAAAHFAMAEDDDDTDDDPGRVLAVSQNQHPAPQPASPLKGGDNELRRTELSLPIAAIAQIA